MNSERIILIASLFMALFMGSLHGQENAAEIRFESLASYDFHHPGAEAYVENFDLSLGTSAAESGTGTPLPRGWYGTFTATSEQLGLVVLPTAKTNTWSQNGQGIRNFAEKSLYDEKPEANANNQNTYPYRSLGATNKNGLGEDYHGSGSLAFGLNLKTKGYEVKAIAFDLSSISIFNTRDDDIGDPVPIGTLLNWSLQFSNHPAGPWVTVGRVDHQTDLGGATPGGFYRHQFRIDNLEEAINDMDKLVEVNNVDKLFIRLVVTSTSNGVGGSVRASYAIDNFTLGYEKIPGFEYNGEDELPPDPDARFDYIQDFNGLDNTSLNAVEWSNGWENNGNRLNRYGLKRWYFSTTKLGVPNHRYVSGNGYIYTFERSDAGVIGYDDQDRVIYNETGGPPAVVNYGGVSGIENIENRSLGFRFSHEGAKNGGEAFYAGYVHTNETSAIITRIEIEFYLAYWQRMGTPAWVRMDFGYKNLGKEFDEANFKIHQVEGVILHDQIDAKGNHVGLSYLQFEHKGGLSAGTSFPKNDSQSWSLSGQNMSSNKFSIVDLETPLQPGESLLLIWNTHGNGIDYGAHILAIDNVKIRFISE